MCGIIGSFNNPKSRELAAKMLSILEHRGRDSNKIINLNNGTIGHCLHAIVGNVPQPLTANGTIVANCEIYNWEELNKIHKLNAKNDAELILNLCDKFGVEKTVDILDGVYAFAY